MCTLFFFFLLQFGVSFSCWIVWCCCCCCCPYYHYKLLFISFYPFFFSDRWLLLKEIYYQLLFAWIFTFLPFKSFLLALYHTLYFSFLFSQPLSSPFIFSCIIYIYILLLFYTYNFILKTVIENSRMKVLIKM